MKKITLTFIVTFLVIIGFILLFGLGKKATQPTTANVKTKATTVINPPILKDTQNQPPTDSTGQPILTLSEVAKHASTTDCYLVINNNVYSVGSYISQHPGGKRTISVNCGKEVTSIFARIHSNRAWDLLKNFKVGVLESEQTVSTIQYDLASIQQGLEAANPQAEVISVQPSGSNFIAKMLLDATEYEVHINSKGEIVKEEVAADELNWDTWNTDDDDK